MEGRRALVHGHEPVEQVACTAHRWNIDTCQGRIALFPMSGKGAGIATGGVLHTSGMPMAIPVPKVETNIRAPQRWDMKENVSGLISAWVFLIRGTVSVAGGGGLPLTLLRMSLKSP